MHGRLHRGGSAICKACAGLACLAATLFATTVLARSNQPTIVQAGDIQVWDEQYLRGEPKGWTVPPDYHEIFGKRKYGGGVADHLRFGRFGRMSGQYLYTSWRPTLPLSDEAYAAGKTGVLDTHVSELLTPAFEIKLDYVTLLISGGNMPGKACVNLVVDGNVVRSATGRDDDMLEPIAFDVKGLRGQQAQIQVLDTSTGAFGYITVDCVYQSTDTKGAVRVIAQPPSDSAVGVGGVQTTAGTVTGPPSVADGQVLVAGQPTDLKQMIRLRTGVAFKSSDASSRVQLINGDILSGEVVGLDKEILSIDQTLLGKTDLKIEQVAQAVFLPGPTDRPAPGTLVQINGNLIPGKLVWIREENIAINCSLGIVPLPRTRVRSFVFAKMVASEDAGDSVAFTDGSILTGQLSVKGNDLVLTHALLGVMKLDFKKVAQITRSLANVTHLSAVKGEVLERVGPILPPAPQTVDDQSGELLLMYPRSVVRYTLAASDQPRRLRAALSSMTSSRAGVTVVVTAGDKTWTQQVTPGSDPIDVDIDLGLAKSIEIEVKVDPSQTITFPSGVVWCNALIVEGASP